MADRYTLSDPETQALLDRFLRYVKVDTQSDDNATCFPSTEKQKDLARLLVEEMKALGIKDAHMDEWGYVYGSIPSNLPAGHKVPALGFLSHMDTYHGTPGANVKPQVVRNFDGKGFTLPATGAQSTVQKYPRLANCVGHTLIHTDGTTLLGGDNKAGIAEILTMADWVIKHPAFQHGDIRIAFTPDEEVGRGTEHFDVAKFGCHYAYTLDAGEQGEIEDETFSADNGKVTITGYDTHPGYSKGIMVNAVRVASEMIARLPKNHLSETTEKRESYLHPLDVRGDVSKVEVKFLVRAFNNEELEARENDLRQIIAGLEKEFTPVKIELEIKESYRNMGEPISKDPKVLHYAIEALKRQDIEPIRRAIRGGTDGARLSFQGVLTPNLFTGQQEYHSVNEWISLNWMADAVGAALQIINVWVEKSR